MHNAWRLQAAIARAKRVFAVAGVGEFDPAFQDVDHLKIELVLVQAGGMQCTVVFAFLHADDVRLELAVGRLLGKRPAQPPRNS